MRSLAILVLLAACKKDPDNVGDPRGSLIFESSSPFGVGLISQEEGLLVVFEERDLDVWHAGIADHDGFSELAAPPLEPDDVFALGRAMDAEAVLGIVRGSAVEVSILDGSWQTLPAPPLDASGLDITEILEHDGSVYVVVGGHLLVWDGVAWTDRLQGSAVILGGFSGDVQWAIVSEGSDFSLVRIEGDVVGEPIPGGSGTPETSAGNGDADGFQVFLSGTMCTFDGEVFEAVESASFSPYAAPGSERVVTGTGAPNQAWELYENGASVGVALTPFAPDVDYVELRPTLDATEMAILVADPRGDGHGLWVRFLELPFEGDPYAE